MDTSFYTEIKDASIPNPLGKYKDIKCIVIDVDGTMTDAGIYYDLHGNEIKKFCTKDAAGFFAAKVCKLIIVILTGRECEATTRRMEELQVDYIFQNVKNKVLFMEKFLEEYKLNWNNIAYLGDDLNDYECMIRSKFKGCPSDAAEEIKFIADIVSDIKGGYGAVRSLISQMLMERGQWNDAIKVCYKIKS